MPVNHTFRKEEYIFIFCFLILKVIMYNVFNYKYNKTFANGNRDKF